MAEPTTLVHRIEKWARVSGDRPALFDREGPGSWSHLTWKQYWEAVREAAKGFIELGVESGDCVAIVGANRSDWVICEFGIMAAGGIPAPIYVTNTPEQVAFIVRHSEATVAICDDAEQYEKYRQCLDEEGILVEKIVTMDDLGVDEENVMTLDELRALGRDQSDDELDARLEAIDPEEAGLLIYTSGTTGVPKAVQLDHIAMAQIGDALVEKANGLDQQSYKVLSYLPLCHVAEQLFTNFAHLSTGGEVWFCQDLKQLKDHLPEVRPTLFLGVPRVWEKFEAALRARFAEATGLKAKLLDWATKTELEAFYREVETGRPVNSLGRGLANKLVIDKLKGALGLDQVEVAGTGAAPISKKTLEFFASLGLRVTEAYGMSETTGVATVSDIDRPVFGYVGEPLPGVEVRIADDGEIQLKGRTMTRGYLRQPEQTAELFTDDGWLCTGDLGEMENGLLKITGRKKDILITAGGKNVAPIEIEAHVNSIPGVGQTVVVGDRQPYLSALVTLDSEALPELCNRLSLEPGELEDIATDPEVRKYLQERIEADCNAKLARYQTIKKFEILPVEFSVDGGELTPTMKIKRNIVSDKYAAQIASFYA